LAEHLFEAAREAAYKMKVDYNSEAPSAASALNGVTESSSKADAE